MVLYSSNKALLLSAFCALLAVGAHAQQQPTPPAFDTTSCAGVTVSANPSTGLVQGSEVTGTFTVYPGQL